jgi:hypothetical protein
MHGLIVGLADRTLIFALRAFFRAFWQTYVD